MAIITPNFNFDGKCEEAIYLYQKAFDAESTACFGTAMQNGTIFIENCQRTERIYLSCGTPYRKSTDHDGG